MIDYKVEDFKLLKDPSVSIEGTIYVKVFKWETEFSQEEKLQFIDKYEYRGDARGKDVGTYAYNLFKKWEAELPSLVQGKLTHDTVEEWFEKNDPRQVTLCLGYKTVEIFVYGVPYTSPEEMVDRWFHKLLELFCEMERTLAVKKRNRTSKIIKAKKVRKYGKKYSTLNLKIIEPLVKEGLKIYPKYEFEDTFYTAKPTEQELDKVLKLYEEIESFANSKAVEYANNFGWELSTK